jgi:hypothetical protein
MEHVSRRSPLPRDEFHAALRAWHADAPDGEVIRETSTSDEDLYDGDDWVWVKHLGNRFYLHADTTRAGIERYLQILDAEGETIRWSAAPGTGDRPVSVGADGEVIEEFRLYRAT